MSENMFENRRLALQSAAVLALASLGGKLTDLVPAAAAAEPAQAQSKPDEAAAPPAGKPGDFDFLAGEWRIRHRRLKSPDEWDEFNGEATCISILGGVGSVEELRIPARNFSGMGLRLLDLGAQVWNDFWVNAASGVLTTPGQTGHFQDGVGTFSADDVDGEQPIKVRGVWDRITPTSCRWQQAVSRDDGKTWEVNWSMDWQRA